MEEIISKLTSSLDSPDLRVDTKTDELIKDQFNRTMRKLRISLMDACNFKCNYCMPEQFSFESLKKLLSVSEIKEFADKFYHLGIEELRLTGGEPTLRADFYEILEAVSEIPFKRIGLTTNGAHLKLNRIEKTNLTNINFSLDSLNEKTFFEICKKDSYKVVLSNILKAKKMGLEVKINCVLMKGINDHEVDQFIHFSSVTGIPVRFLELMKIGVANEIYEKHFMSADEVLRVLDKKYELKSVQTQADSTSFEFTMDSGAHIGFIASESRPFCTNCSRIRVSSKGEFLPCLMKETSVDIRDLSFEKLREVIGQSINLKPIDRPQSITTPMHQIGG